MFEPSLFSEDLDHVIKFTRNDWEELRGKRVFLTGGTGFFGMWLIESFLWANEKLNLGAEMVVLSRTPRAFLTKMPHLDNQPALSFHTGDVRSFAFPAGQFSHVIHAAADTSSTALALDTVDTIVNGTQHVLEFARQCGTATFLFVSSGAVYGQTDNITHISEDYRGGPNQLNPSAAYGESKRLAEHLCMLFSYEYDVDVKISRGFSFVGPYLPLDAHFAIGNFIRNALDGDPIVITGGRAVRSYLYAADLAIWLWTILFRGVTGRAYNTGSDEGVTIYELAERVMHTLTPGRGIHLKPESTSIPPLSLYVPWIGRARELGLEVRIDLCTAIRQTGRWHCRQSA